MSTRIPFLWGIMNAVHMGQQGMAGPHAARIPTVHKPAPLSYWISLVNTSSKTKLLRTPRPGTWLAFREFKCHIGCRAYLTTTNNNKTLQDGNRGALNQVWDPGTTHVDDEMKGQSQKSRSSNEMVSGATVWLGQQRM